MPDKKNEIILNGLDNAFVLKDLVEMERPVSYMYLDSKGNVTAGAGQMIPSAEKARDLQFRFYENGKSDRYATKGKDVIGWPKLIDSINRRDWVTAAKESHRKDVHEERNKFVHGLFMDAMSAGRSE